MSDLEYLLKHAPIEYDVTCARCGKVLSCRIAYIEEGDEWECPECWDRCQAEEMAVTVSAPAATELLPLHCVHGKRVYERCEQCETSATGFTRAASTADAGHSVQCSECGATHVLRYTDRAKTAVSLAGFDGWSVDSSRVRCPKCSTASTVSAGQESKP